MLIEKILDDTYLQFSGLDIEENWKKEYKKLTGNDQLLNLVRKEYDVCLDSKEVDGRKDLNGKITKLMLRHSKRKTTTL